MENQFAYTTQIKPRRPTFLLVLCILSFVMTFVGLLYYGFLAVSTFLQPSMSYSQPPIEGFGGMQEALNQMTFWMKVHYYTAFLCEFISLVGIILMFNLKRAGFIIYTVAEIAPCIAGIISAYQIMPLFSGIGGLFGMSPLFGGMSMVGSFIVLFFDVAFIILYALNFKHMR